MAGYVPDIIPPVALRCRDTFLTGMLEMQVRKKTLEGIDSILLSDAFMMAFSVSRTTLNASTRKLIQAGIFIRQLSHLTGLLKKHKNVLV